MSSGNPSGKDAETIQPEIAFKLVPIWALHIYTHIPVSAAISASSGVGHFFNCLSLGH
jgi:hypothetical protein